MNLKVTEKQKVFEMTPNSFKRSPIYLYWDKLPIEKVEFRLKNKYDDTVFIFRGTGTNSISWFQKEKLSVDPTDIWVPQTVTFNANFNYPEFTIEYNTGRIEAKRESGNTENYGLSDKTSSGLFQYFEARNPSSGNLRRNGADNCFPCSLACDYEELVCVAMH
ncbi:uncharacterized protein LOC118761499 [Octopus sinensis]|uniref:Uncharacterized protein LOC118761499 n=1 Tax=Octopus sinensis TaxID=2607531 RepID=A0A7E6EJ67_9MOLL|nr:uncharacterized protein LOC118761499 [Octopus sinensis]